MYLFVCLFIYLFIYLFVCLLTYLQLTNVQLKTDTILHTNENSYVLRIINANSRQLPSKKLFET